MLRAVETFWEIFRGCKTLGFLQRELKEVFHRWAKQKEGVIEAGQLRPDHAPMLIAIPPKHSVASILGFLKGKSSMQLCRAQVLGPGLFCLHRGRG